jgi:hypothetical protein
MAILISVGAGMVLGQLGGMMIDLSGRDIPRLAASLQFATQSAALASQGPALLASRSEDALQERIKTMKATQEIALEKLGEIIELGADKDVVAALNETVKNIDDTIKSLGAAARERLDAAASHEKLYRALRSAQAGFVAAASPAMMDAQLRTNAILGSANLSQDDATEAARTVEQLGNVISSSNLMASDMTAALSADGSDTLDAIEKEFQQTQARVRSNLELLPKNNGTKALKEAALKLLALGEGKASVFKIRQKELDANDYGQIVLDETRKLNVGLGVSVKQLVDGVQTDTDAATWRARQKISLATMIMLALGGLTLVGSALFVWLYVGRNILRRIHTLQRSMQLLSDGDLETEIYRSRHSDEIGVMASSLEIFRENDRSAQPEHRAGQGSYRQGRARLAHGSPDRRLRSHRPHGAGRLADLSQFHADHGAKHGGDRRPLQRAGRRGGVRRGRDLGKCADGVVGHRGIVGVDFRNRPPGHQFRANCRQGRRRGQRNRRHHAGARR